MITDHFQCRPTPVLGPERCELVSHNCDNDHVWVALMAVRKDGTACRYIQAGERFCPKCGLPQAELEII